MSALTRANKYNRVRFRDAAGHILTGLVLHIKADHLLIGVRSVVRPMIWCKARGADKEGMVPNRSIWAVPFSDVVETLMFDSSAA